MKTALLALLLSSPLAAAPPTFAGAPGWSTHAAGWPGICADVVSDGAAGVRMSVVARPEIAPLIISWNADGTKESLTTLPARTGLQALVLISAGPDGRRTRSVWVPTMSTEPLEFRVELLGADGTVLDSVDLGTPDPSGARPCAALP